jgi:SSS family solute:Na+ symporter
VLNTGIALATIALALALFAWVGFRAKRGAHDLEEYLVARNSQGALPLGLSFLASGMGAWILFAPPEVGAFVGLVGVLGYALGAAAPILAFALLGRRMRRIVPEGHTLTEFVGARFGRLVQSYVILIAILYMFIFLAAELTAVGGVTAILSGADPRLAIMAVAAVTLAYTTYGGLPASLRTDRWQAWLLLALLAIGAVAVLGRLSDPVEAFTGSGLLAVERGGIEVAVTLVIAITAANLFHEGYWQRVWAARDPGALARGAAVGIAGTIPVVAVVGLLGLLAAGSALDLGSPPVPFFALVAGLPAWVAVVVLLLGVSLVSSSVDTLVNGLVALVASEARRVSLTGARIVTVALMIPAALIAWQGYSVLRLFLVADLLAAATIVPVMFGLWRRATSASTLAGALAGLAGGALPGLLETGSLVEGVRLATFPGTIPTMPPFLGAVLASTAVATAVMLVAPRKADLTAIGHGTAALAEG